MIDSLPYSAGCFLEIRKIAPCKNPVTEAGSWDNWIPGGENDCSLPVDYVMRGVLLDPIRVGGRLWLYRTYRNGVEADGFFNSSPIITIPNGSIVETFNSIYFIVPAIRPKKEGV